MEIRKIGNLSNQQIRNLVSCGGTFVMYKYSVSIIFMSFNRPSHVYFIAPGKSKITPGLGYLAISFFFGWWGIPWGPIYTVGNIFNVLTGGKDVTKEVMGYMNYPVSNTTTKYNREDHNYSR